MGINNLMRNLTIKRQFTVSAVTVVIIIMLIFDSIRIIMITVSIDDDISQKIETTAKLTSLSFVDPIWNLNKESIYEISNALLQDKDIEYILVKAEGNGEIFSKYNSDITFENKDQVIFKKVEVIKDDLKIGEITIGITKYYRMVELKNELLATCIRILVMVFVLWSAIDYVSRLVTKSIDELSEGTDEISNGNLTHRLSGDSFDEIGQLAIKFNGMTEKLYNMIQERDKAIRNLRASEEKFNKAFYYCADIIGIIRLKDKIFLEINEAFLRVFGYKREEIIGHRSSEFNLWVDKKHHAQISEVVDSGNLVDNEETSWAAKNGKIRVGLYSTEIIEIGGELCVLFVWNDITERKKVDEVLKRAHYELETKVGERTKQLREALFELGKQHSQLKLAQSKLIQSEKMASLGTLVAGVAHEINNPINYAFLSSKVLDKDLANFKDELIYSLDKPDDEIMNFLEKYFSRFSKSINNILVGSNQIKTIVKELRLFSRLDEAEKNEIYISEALETTVRLVKTNYINKINFTFNFYTDGKIECFPSQLNQVFINIIVNACQAIIKKQEDSQEEVMGNVNIRVLDSYDDIIIEFHDDGCGMTEEVKSKIFEPFFTTKAIGQGTGLGMSISYGIIERHNGRIEVKSKVGLGSIVTIYLPYKMKFS